MSLEPCSVFVVGGAGFIGSHLVQLLAERGHKVCVFDDFSVGREGFLDQAMRTGRVSLVRGDARDRSALERAMRGASAVVHLAANPEARRGLMDDRIDVALGLETTLEVLSAMQAAKVRRLIFASSGTVYGDRAEPAGETDLGSLPVSLYGASKLASEAFISAHVACFDLGAVVLRFGNVVGPRATHGVIKDFVDQLVADPTKLIVLGNGTQQKPYLHVSDCAFGIHYALLHLAKGEPGQLTTWNLTPRTQTAVRTIAEWVVAQSPNPAAEILLGQTTRGWRGDVPVSRLLPDKLSGHGFTIHTPSDTAVQRAISEIWAERGKPS